MAEKRVNSRAVVYGSGTSKEDNVEGPLYHIQRVMARESHRTEVHSGKAGRAGRGEDHGSRAGEEGEGERNGNVHTRRMGKQGGEVGEGDPRQQQPSGCWMSTTITTYVEGAREQLKRHMDDLLCSSTRHSAIGH